VFLIDHVNGVLLPAAAGGDPEIYSAYNAGSLTMTRNSACWAPGDKTGIAAKQAGGSFPITNKHIIVPAHTGGDQAPHYWDVSGTRYDRTVVGSPVQVGTAIYPATGSYDFRVCLLDSPLPAGIKPYKLLPPDWRRWMPLSGGMAVWRVNQFGQISLMLTRDISGGSFMTAGAGYESVTIAVATGDSGWFDGTTINGENVVLSNHGTSGSVSDLATQINAAIETLSPGEGYSVGYVDLSTFTEAAVLTEAFTPTAVASNPNSAWSSTAASIMAGISGSQGASVSTADGDAPLVLTLTPANSVTGYNFNFSFTYDAVDIDGDGGQLIVVEFLDGSNNVLGFINAVELAPGANVSGVSVVSSVPLVDGPIASLSAVKLRLTAAAGINTEAAIFVVKNLALTYERVGAAAVGRGTQRTTMQMSMGI
jgi:hypothetical protein